VRPRPLSSLCRELAARYRTKMASALPALAAALLAALPVGALRHSSQAAQGSLSGYSFRDFVAEYGREYREGSEEYEMRRGLFEARKDEIARFRAASDRSWEMGVNRFLDFTEAEKKGMLGYRGSRSTNRGAAVEFQSSATAAALPQEFFVLKPKAKLMGLIRDQGSCGSCWAMAAVSTLEGQMEATVGLMSKISLLSGNSTARVPATPTLASQTIVSCTENPRNCGGTGGCGGATVELAYDMIKNKGGLPFAADWPYESGNGDSPRCKTGLFKEARLQVGGYTVLPSNKVKPLKEALVSSGGPIAISVDATNWFLYTAGVFNDGAGDFTVNHAVTLMGYKEPKDGNRGFWKVKNSWGEYWGENGYIRIEMRTNEEAHCGWDYDTHQGLACEGDPDKAWVCGTSGILYDSVYPTGLHLK